MCGNNLLQLALPDDAAVSNRNGSHGSFPTHWIWKAEWKHMKKGMFRITLQDSFLSGSDPMSQTLSGAIFLAPSPTWS